MRIGVRHEKKLAVGARLIGVLCYREGDVGQAAKSRPSACHRPFPKPVVRSYIVRARGVRFAGSRPQSVYQTPGFPQRR
jgi:hypothetical protein